MSQANIVDMLVHVRQSDAKARLVARLNEYPGVFESRITTPRPHLLFVSHDPVHFDIRTVPGIARALGIEASIVEI